MTAISRSLIIAAASFQLWQASAQTTVPPAAKPPPPPLSPTEQSIQDLKHPVSWLTWGSDLRLRNEYFYDLLTLNPNANLNEQDYFRFRARLWTSIAPVEGLSLNARLATEPRTWMKPAGYSPVRGTSGTDWTEGIFDNLNVQWKNILDQPLSIIVGRQDILLGDGWLVGDGTPYDGSWTYYLDSARASYELKEQHTTIEAIGILQYAKDDEWLPTINNQDRFQIEQDEKGAILTILNSSMAYANLNPYFFYKHDTKVSDPKAPRTGDNADIYTMGARIFGAIDEHWKYSVEGAYQLGEKQDLTVKSPSVSSAFRDLNSYGLNSKVSYAVKDELNNQFSFSYEYLSGDDPSTDGDEMFDSLWGRWPRWSEIGLYSVAAETRIGQQANLHRFGPAWGVTPLKNLDFTAAYYALFADQQVPTRQAAPGLFSNDGYFRGHFATAILKYKFSPHLSGHLWSEFLFPGDFYVHKDMISFLRAEIFLTF